MIIMFLVSTLFFQTHLLDAFAHSDVKTIQGNMEPTVLINIDDDIDFFNREEAAKRLTTFFEANQPKAYKESFRKTVSGSTLFVNADLFCGTGTFRLNLVINNQDGKEIISEIKLFKN